MAVITVSKIQVRSGYQEDLPALDTGEFGWCVDTQRLFIGKGTLAEGAPTTGVTEILTEYSNGLISQQLTQVDSDIANVNAYLANVTPLVSNLQPLTYVILDNQPGLTNIAEIILETSSSEIIDYNIARGSSIRTGMMRVANYDGSVAVFDDEYVENADTGVTLYWTGNATSGNLILGYTSTNTGSDAYFTYTHQHLKTVP